MPDVILTDDARRLNLEHQKKRAKELRRALQAGDPAAIGRFRAAHPKAYELGDAEVVARLAKVSESQLVIARELGLPSWPRLKDHIERWTRARREVADGAAPVDTAIPTTHVRCGTDIRDALKRAGIGGTFVEFADPYCQGPVPESGDLLEVRADFLARLGTPRSEALSRLRQEMEALAATRARRRVVLWFEHDSYDQLILARILAFYAVHGPPESLELVCIDGFPGVDRFNGLGQLSPAALRMLWDDRTPVGGDLLRLGTRVWDALREPTPVALQLATRVSDALPQMGAATLRHLQELPWTTDGLSLTQRLTLQLLEDAPSTAGSVFRRLVLEAEPLVFLGDAMYWVVLEELARAHRPAISVDEGPRGKEWRTRGVALTDVGRELLRGDRDWMDCGPDERWVGGVRLRPGEAAWRWTGGEVRLV